MKNHVKVLYVLIVVLFIYLLHLLRWKDTLGLENVHRIALKSNEQILPHHPDRRLTQNHLKIKSQTKLAQSGEGQALIKGRPAAVAHPEGKDDEKNKTQSKDEKVKSVPQRPAGLPDTEVEDEGGEKDVTDGDEGSRPALQWPVDKGDLHPDVKLVPSSPEPGFKLPYRKCIPLPQAPRKGIYVCTHPTMEDRAVSGNLQRGNLWEEKLIKMMDGMLREDPSLMLFDIGCNLGEYTLWAAALGREVVAVDMLLSNVHLVQVALSLSGLTDKVTIVNNALYSDHRTLRINVRRGSVGASRLNTTKMMGVMKEAAVSAQTICIDDLVPLMKGRNVYIKMDIENSEHTALAGAYKFFQEVNVKVVQMEWHRKIPEESVPILAFMNQYGYVPSYKPMPYDPVDLNKDKRNIDIFFLKKSEFGIK